MQAHTIFVQSFTFLSYSLISISIPMLPIEQNCGIFKITLIFILSQILLKLCTMTKFCQNLRHTKLLAWNIDVFLNYLGIRNNAC